MELAGWLLGTLLLEGFEFHENGHRNRRHHRRAARVSCWSNAQHSHGNTFIGTLSGRSSSQDFFKSIFSGAVSSVARWSAFTPSLVLRGQAFSLVLFAISKRKHMPDHGFCHVVMPLVADDFDSHSALTKLFSFRKELYAVDSRGQRSYSSGSVKEQLVAKFSWRHGWASKALSATIILSACCHGRLRRGRRRSSTTKTLHNDTVHSEL